MVLPITRTRTDHAMIIKVDGVSIGHIQDWTPQQSRTVTPVYQFSTDSAEGSSGTVVENVPGNIGGLTIGVNRYDLYTKKMEEVWGNGFSITMLTDQERAITIREVWKKIDENGNTTSESWAYEGVWFTSLGRTHSANGDRITKVNASFMYARKNRGA